MGGVGCEFVDEVFVEGVDDRDVNVDYGDGDFGSGLDNEINCVFYVDYC